MFGMDASLVKLAAVLALSGLLPVGTALASEHARRSEAALAGTVQQVMGENLLLRAEDGRQVRVKAEGCATRLAAGENVRLQGYWKRQGRFEATALDRPEGRIACDDDDRRHAGGRPDRLAASAPVNAAAAIAAAQQAGHSTVTEVEWEHGGWQLRAVDASGRLVRLMVDGWSGQVTTRPQRF